jgi:hypothetical protein
MKNINLTISWRVDKVRRLRAGNSNSKIQRFKDIGSNYLQKAYCKPLKAYSRLSVGLQ